VFLYGTNPLAADSDADRMPDGFEVGFGLDPWVDDAAADLDFDEVSNYSEFQWTSDPSDPTSIPAARVAYSVSSDRLFEIDLVTGGVAQVGFLGPIATFGGITFGNDRDIYVIDEGADDLYRIDVRTGMARRIGAIGFDCRDTTLAFDDAGDLSMTSTTGFYSVDPAIGEATYVGPLGTASLDGMTWNGTELYAVGARYDDTWVIDRATGSATHIGYLETIASGAFGLASNSRGQLVGLANSGYVFLVDPSSGSANVLYDIGNYSLHRLAIEGFRDTDGDLLPDHWEAQFGLDAADASDAFVDGDGDGLINRDEYEERSDPNSSATAGDGLDAGTEVMVHGTDPSRADTDGDVADDGV